MDLYDIDSLSPQNLISVIEMVTKIYGFDIYQTKASNNSEIEARIRGAVKMRLIAAQIQKGFKEIKKQRNKRTKRLI